ncbi:MAG: rhodanese-like domain-containing protein, partial [Nitrosopumilus sp.]|nr:rhodanese-like domain-containing protein [Nitrosopumilus sp.]
MLYSNYLDFELMLSQQFVILGIAITVSVFAGILIGTSMNQDAQTLDNPYAYDADTVYEKLQKNEIYVIDIRNESEYSKGHIPGSSIDYLYGDTLDKRISTIQKKLPDFTFDKKLVLVDNDGVHAKYIAKSMSDEGIETYFLKSGLSSWDKELEITTSAKIINSEKLTSLISQNEDIYLLDVREPSELEVTKIESSVNIPLSEIFEVNGMDDIPTDKPVIVICGSGNRATIATYALAQNEIDFQVLKGGIKAWDVYSETSELDRIFEKMDDIHAQHQSQMSQMWQSMDDVKQQEFLEKLTAKITKMENMDISEHFLKSNHGM